MSILHAWRHRKGVGLTSLKSMVFFSISILFCFFTQSSLAVAIKHAFGSTMITAPPIVYTIAGSDSGGGAGIQADLHAIHSMQCHGCSAITCLTAQNSIGVSSVHAPPPAFLKEQLNTLLADLPPRAIKIGMLGTKELAECCGEILKQVQESEGKVWVVLDPVMISTSGHKLIDDGAKEAMIKHVFPHADVLTPNRFEAEELLGRKLQSCKEIEQGARELLELGVKSVLIKGGHTEELSTQYAQDFFISSLEDEREERLCDGSSGVWLRGPRYDTEDTHGTGCTLSSAIASALALGETRRRHAKQLSDEGATSAIQVVDGCCLAKAYVTAGVFHGCQLGSGPGPVVHTTFPSSSQHFPSIAIDSSSEFPAFLPMQSFSRHAGTAAKLGRILPVVDSFDWVERLAKTPGVTDIQLRIKDEHDPAKIDELCLRCQEICQAEGVHLWINDHWEAAVKAGCFGVHVGQEDLARCLKSGGLDELRKQNVALGISTHSYGELSAALGIKPSYISLGPIFATSSKKVEFDPQGLSIVSRWRSLIPPEIPLVVIGGINDASRARECRDAGADCVAVIGAVTRSNCLNSSVTELNAAMSN